MTAIQEQRGTVQAKPPQKKKPHGFLHHAAIYGLGAVSLQLVSIVLMPVYTSHLSTAEYGLLQAIYRVGTVLNICLMISGIRLATFNLWGRSENLAHRSRLPASVLALTVGVVAGGSLVGWLTADLLAAWLGIADANLLAFGVMTMLLNALTIIPLALMQARMESLWYVVSTLLITVSQLTSVAISLVVFEAGVGGVLCGLALTFGFYGWLLMARELWLSWGLPDQHQMRDILKFALPFIPSGLFFFVLQSGDQFFLLKYHGLAAVGIYALAYKITQGVVTFATQPFLQVWVAWMHQAYRQPNPEIVFGQVITRIMSVLMFAGTALVLFQSELLWALSTPTFERAGTVLGILTIAHGFLVLGNLLDGALYVTRRTDLKPWVAGASAVVMTVAYAVLIPRAEIYGAAWSTLIGFVFFGCLNLAVAQRVFRIRLEYRRLATVFGLAVVLSALGRSLDFSGLSFVIKLCLLMLLPTLLWGLAVISAEEKAYALHAFARLRHWAAGT